MKIRSNHHDWSPARLPAVGIEGMYINVLDVFQFQVILPSDEGNDEIVTLHYDRHEVERMRDRIDALLTEFPAPRRASDAVLSAS